MIKDKLECNCKGCSIELTLKNSMGDKVYCTKCVEAFPNDPCWCCAYEIQGKYPNFEWVEQNK